ncbi:hypothetical protein H2248_001984 [Termitomyces sp. 'cryptogamus']|nr:hypothetical protein H2248_001984 [Termitomyces sp. 'cryptogamus']
MESKGPKRHDNVNKEFVETGELPPPLKWAARDTGEGSEYSRHGKYRSKKFVEMGVLTPLLPKMGTRSSHDSKVDSLTPRKKDTNADADPRTMSMAKISMNQNIKSMALANRDESIHFH